MNSPVPVPFLAEIKGSSAKQADLLRMQEQLKLYTSQHQLDDVASVSGSGYARGGAIQWSASRTAYPRGWLVLEQLDDLATGFRLTQEVRDAMDAGRQDDAAARAPVQPLHPRGVIRPRRTAGPGSTGMPGFSDAEFVAGTVRGYRWWSLDAPRLDLSPYEAGGMAWTPGQLHGQQAPWGPGINEARCLGGRPHPESEIPDENCGCITPETRVLTADLRWVPAGELSVGEHLLAFDEYPANRPVRGGQPGRKYRDAVVASTERGPLPCYDLEFEDGTSVRVSADHRWLVYSGQKGAHWVRTDELRAGDQRASRVVKPFTPWEAGASWEAGYLAAAFDGEGHLVQLFPRYAFRVGFSQADNPMLAETERCLKELGFDFVHRVKTRHKLLRVDGSPRLDNHLLELTDRPEMLRFLGIIRPVRLLPKFQPGLLGRMNMGHRVRLVRKTYVGEQEVVKLGTTAGTYFAEGMASHNCGFWAYWDIQHHNLGGAGRLPVVGVIEGTGQLLIGPKGFRAGKAKIIALHLPFDIQPDLPPASPPAHRPGTPYRAGQGNPWTYLERNGEVRYLGSRRPAPEPEPVPPSAEEIQAAWDAAEAWKAVIGDRLAELYPGTEICETLAYMMAKYEVVSEYPADTYPPAS